MKLPNKTLLFVLGLLAVAHGDSGASAFLNMDVVMRGGDVIHEMDESDFPKYRGGKCTIRFPKDGNFATQNGFYTGGFDANQNSQCGYGDGGKKMLYRLQKDGNFVAYCQYSVDYTTHTNQGMGDGDYFMAIDDSCILHIYRGVLDCNSVSIQDEIWTNIRKEPLKNGDRLGKGEIVRVDGTSLVLQSSDGNLALYEGVDDQKVLWAANQDAAWDGYPSPGIRDYYARVTNNGRLLLVSIDWSDGQESVYFRKKLKNYSDGMSSCFTVEYDSDQDDLVAVSCDERRSLRGRI